MERSAGGSGRQDRGGRPTMAVAMCTYQGEDYLGEQLRSIREQTRPPDAMVIRDDASSDRTVGIARGFAREAPFPVRVERNGTNLGFVRNFGRVIGECGTDVIVLADQDDVWRADKLALLEDAFVGSPDALVAFSDAELVDEDLRPLGLRLWDAAGFTAARRRRAGRAGLYRELLRGNLVTGATLAMRRELLPLALPLPEGVVHDGWIALLGALAGEALWVEEPLVLYRQHPGNQIGARRPRLLERVRHGRAGREQDLARLRDQHRAALARLGSSSASPARLDELARAAGHADARVRAIRRERGAVRRVASELGAGHYHRFSRGFASVVLDLMA